MAKSVSGLCGLILSLILPSLVGMWKEVYGKHAEESRVVVIHPRAFRESG